MNRSLMLFGVACVPVLLLNACGDSGSSKPPSPTVAPAPVAATPSLAADNFSDKHWKNGVWILTGERAAFFFTSAPGKPGLKPGDTLVFAKSGERKIKTVTPAGVFTNVDVEGVPLDPMGDGFPNPIRLK